MNKKNIQFFNWGQIEWIYEPESINSSNVMNIGVCTIFPGERQHRHIHYGDEQFIYVLSGNGKQLIGNEISIIESGALFHIEAGSIHETINIGNEPIKQLLISIPVYQENMLPIHNRINRLFESKEKHEITIEINNEIKYLYDEFINILKVPISIFNKKDDTIIEGYGFPDFCMHKCNVHINIKNCCLYQINDEYIPPQYKEPSAFICPYGLTVFVLPIFCNDEVIGFIKGGHILKTQNKVDLKDNNSPQGSKLENLYELIQIVPKGTVRAILYQMKKLSKNIINYYIFENAEIELNKRKEIIQDIVKNEFMLEESLRLTREKVLSIQINNHFLFNTLNAVASLSIKEGAYRTYESIVNLSKMFRYPLKTSSNLVEFKDEIDYINNYFELQKLRYGDKLNVNCYISDEVKNITIPFNCLQPIVENSFVHGFTNNEEIMQIQVVAKKDVNNISIEISDNGIGMEPKYVEELNETIRGEENQTNFSGLMLIFSKLQLFYHSNFTFEICSTFNKGTTVRIVLPINTI